jgi:hypothetical protein
MIHKNPIPTNRLDRVTQIFNKRKPKGLDLETFIQWINEANPFEKPGDGDYSQWIAKLVLSDQGGLVFPEDIAKVKSFLIRYHQAKKKKTISAEASDVNRFKNWKVFFDAVNPHLDAFSSRDLGLSRKEYKIMYQSKKYLVLEIAHWRSAQKIAQGTNWCVIGEEMAKHYTENEPLYFILKNSGDGFKQFGLLTNKMSEDEDERQFRDTSDRTFLNRYEVVEIIENEELEFADTELVDALTPISPWLFCKEHEIETFHGKCPNCILGQGMKEKNPQWDEILEDYPSESIDGLIILRGFAIRCWGQDSFLILFESIYKYRRMTKAIGEEYGYTFPLSEHFSEILCSIFTSFELHLQFKGHGYASSAAISLLSEDCIDFKSITSCVCLEAMASNKDWLKRLMGTYKSIQITNFHKNRIKTLLIHLSELPKHIGKYLFDNYKDQPPFLHNLLSGIDETKNTTKDMKDFAVNIFLNSNKSKYRFSAFFGIVNYITKNYMEQALSIQDEKLKLDILAYMGEKSNSEDSYRIPKKYVDRLLEESVNGNDRIANVAFLAAAEACQKDKRCAEKILNFAFTHDRITRHSAWIAETFVNEHEMYSRGMLKACLKLYYHPIMRQKEKKSLHETIGTLTEYGSFPMSWFRLYPVLKRFED